MAAEWGHYRTPAGRAVYYVLAPEHRSPGGALPRSPSGPEPAACPRGKPRAGTVNREPPEVHRPRCRRRRLPPRRHARHRFPRPRPVAARPGPARVPAACMTVWSAAASPSGQGSGGVPRAAASAAPTRLEQAHERKPEPGRRYTTWGRATTLGPHAPRGAAGRHHVGPLGATRRGDVRVSRNARRIPAPRGAGGVRRTRPGSAPVGMACPEPHSAGHSRRAGMVSRAANATPSPRPRRPAAAAGRSGHVVPGPAAVEIRPLMARGGRPQGRRTRQPDLGRAGWRARRGGEPVSAAAAHRRL